MRFGATREAQCVDSFTLNFQSSRSLPSGIKCWPYTWSSKSYLEEQPLNYYSSTLIGSYDIPKNGQDLRHGRYYQLGIRRNKGSPLKYMRALKRAGLETWQKRWHEGVCCLMQWDEGKSEYRGRQLWESPEHSDLTYSCSISIHPISPTHFTLDLEFVERWTKRKEIVSSASLLSPLSSSYLLLLRFWLFIIVSLCYRGDCGLKVKNFLSTWKWINLHVAFQINHLFGYLQLNW